MKIYRPMKLTCRGHLCYPCDLYLKSVREVWLYGLEDLDMDYKFPAKPILSMSPRIISDRGADSNICLVEMECSPSHLCERSGLYCEFFFVILDLDEFFDAMQFLLLNT